MSRTSTGSSATCSTGSSAAPTSGVSCGEISWPRAIPAGDARKPVRRAFSLVERRAGCPVNDSHPGAVSPEEMLAYIDGEAPPRVVEHLRSCPDCMAAARGYARVQRRLQRSLQRFDCPSPQRLGDYELDILAPEERTAVAGHVVECPRCTDELRTLRDFLALEIAAPPIGPLERARRLIAALVVPAPGAAHARLRGAADTATQTYRAGDVTISVHTGPGARRGRGSIEGLAWRESGDTEGLAG